MDDVPQSSRSSLWTRLCMVLGLFALALCLATLANLPNRFHVPRSISADVEASRSQTWYLTSLAASLLAFVAGYASRKASRFRRPRLVGLLCASGPVVILLLQVLSVMADRMQGREPAPRAQCVNNLKQIQLGLVNYESRYGVFPPRVQQDRQGSPLLSWRVLILSCIDPQIDLFWQFHLDEPWDSPHNRTLTAPIPSGYVCPGQAEWSRNQTIYQVLDSPGSFLDASRPTRLSQISDGTATTIAVVEGPTPVPWTSPQDVSFRSDEPFRPWEATHPGGFNASFVDGSVRFLRSTINPSVLKALATRAGGESIDPEHLLNQTDCAVVGQAFQPDSSAFQAGKRDVQHTEMCGPT